MSRATSGYLSDAASVMAGSSLTAARALVTLSLLGPAWLIAITPTVSLYLQNQEELRFQIALLLPYTLVCLGISLAALALFLATRENRIGRFFVCFYFISGFAFLASIGLRYLSSSLTVEALSYALLLALFIIIAAVLNRIDDIRRLVTPFAVVAAVLILSDLVKLTMEYEYVPIPISRVSTEEPTQDRPDLPNIYHIIFDEYQTDMFELSVDAQTRKSLQGFTFFPENVTPFGRTGMALPAIFTGREYDYHSPQIDYQKGAFEGPDSILHHLKDLGYTTEAFLHRVYDFSPALFDRVQFHKNTLPFGRRGLHQIFFDLWIFANLPGPLGKRIIGSAQFEQFQNQNVLNPAAPILSLQTMRTVMTYESSRSAHGRYLFVHLLLPHFPSVLDEKCEYQANGERTTPLKQSRCANLLMRELAATLHGLDRFEDSIIVFQSDHGARYIVQDGALQSVEHLGLYSQRWSEARARALLLIKPAGVASTRMETSMIKSSLIDVAPTIMALLGEPLERADGVDLFHSGSLVERLRFYHFYDKKGKNGWTDELTRFRIDIDGMKKDTVVRLANNPRPQ